MTKSRFALFALTLALLVPVWFIVAALGVKFGLWSWRLGLGVLIVRWGPRLLIAATGTAAVALGLAVLAPPRAGWRAALIALVIPLAGLGYLARLRDRSATIPPIHDVATDIVAPPTPSARLMAVRSADDANPVQDMTAPLVSAEAYKGARFERYGGRSLGEVGREAYPALQTAAVTGTAGDAFAKALAVVHDLGWTVVTEDAQGGVIEATAETFWFGFKDDVIVRVRPGADGRGARIDVRSISRVGLSDLGTNAKRIAEFLARVSAGSQPPTRG